MAKQKGIVKFEGTLDDINFYMRKGVPVARKAGGGFTAKVIKNSPNMERVRENSSEFGHCSQIKRLIRESLFVLLQDYKDPSLHARMMRLMQEIKVLDVVAERGKRTVVCGLQTHLGKKLFFDFSFTEKYSFKNVVTVTVDAFTLSCTITHFDSNCIAFPKSATHVKFTYLVCAYDFDALTFTSYPTSVFFERGHEINLPFTLTPNLPLTNLKDVICFCGIRFFQENGDQKLVLKSSNAFGISCVHIGF